MKNSLAGKEVILGVTGGIAAYKSAELVRSLKEKGAGVTVVMTGSAVKFVGPVTFQALSGRPVITGLFDGAMPHIELTAKADVFVVAPATANVIGKMACGIADDLLTTMLLAARCPVIIAPAMNCRMYENPALKRNLATLTGYGVHLAGPGTGAMACGEVGWGRMSEPAEIVDAVEDIIRGSSELSGKTVLVTAGPTLEDIDPVRFIGNRSSGRMGYALAREAVRRGAKVRLVSGPSALPQPFGVELVRVRSASEMEHAVYEAAPRSDVVVMAAAVSDYAPETRSDSKIKKNAARMTLGLIKTPDILGGLGERKRKGQVLVGFAAETEKIKENALKKLKEKRLDLIAANPVGGETGFESEHNILKIYGPKGLLLDTGRVTKDEAARALMDLIVKAIF